MSQKSKPLWEKSWRELDEHEKGVRKKVLKIMGVMRNTLNKDLEGLAKQRGLTVDQVLANTNAISKANGGWEVSPHHTISSHWEFFENGKAKSIYVNDSRESSQISRYFIAVKKLYRQGDASGLKEFQGKFIVDEDGVRHYFETDPQKIQDILERIEDFETYEYYNKGG